MSVINGIMAILLLGMSGALIYVDLQNVQLKRDLKTAFDVTQARVAACVLPALLSTTADSAAMELAFPRSRPLLLLSSRSDCKFCTNALKGWVELIANYRNQVDGFVYDGSRSYSSAELRQSGVDPGTVFTPTAKISPYRELLSTTPTVMLVGRSGRVLAVWRGELSPDRLRVIRSAIQGLMND